MAEESGSQKRSSHCDFFLPKKKRYCLQIPHTDSLYCVHHLAESKKKHEKNEQDLKNEKKTSGNGDSDVEHETKGHNQRVQCPFGNHEVFKHKLNRHLKICENRPLPNPVYYECGVNAGEGASQESTGTVLDGKNYLGSVKDVVSFISLLEFIIFKELGNQLSLVPNEILCHPSLASDLVKFEGSKKATKHRKQHASIVGHLEKMGMLAPQRYSIFEYGAGRAELSLRIKEALDENAVASFFPIDRSKTGSNKADAKIRHLCSKENEKIERLLIDIEHLRLSKVDNFAKDSRNIVVSKHLCGAATDLSLRSLMTFDQDLNKCYNCSPSSRNIDALIIALCCHHRCSWKSFVGKRYFEHHNLSERDFLKIRYLSTWATNCQQGQGLDIDDNASINKQLEALPITDEDFINDMLGADERKRIGLLCKRMIDLGRVDYLKQNGYDATLKYFVSKETTLENCALFATPQN